MDTQTIEPKRSVGRPKANINWDDVAAMLEADCSAVSIADVLGIDEDTLRKRCPQDNNCSFSEFSRRNKAKGEKQLRAKQYEVALSGDKVMLVWLGKNRLGQSDKKEVTTNNATEGVLSAFNLWLEKNPNATSVEKSDAIRDFAVYGKVDAGELGRLAGVDLTVEAVQ